MKLTSTLSVTRVAFLVILVFGLIGVTCKNVVGTMIVVSTCFLYVMGDIVFNGIMGISELYSKKRNDR